MSRRELAHGDLIQGQVDILSDAVPAALGALRRPGVVERHRSRGAEVATSSPVELRRFVIAEIERWGAAARATWVQPQNAG